MSAEKAWFNVDLHDLVVALSEALGLVGGRIINHGKRVAYIALSIAHEMGLPAEDIDELRTAALLHDAGVSRTKVHEKLHMFDWEGALDHCRDGALLLQGFPLFDHVASIILHHHTKWTDLRDQHLNERTAVLANLVFLADRVDISIDWKKEIILCRESIITKITDLSGTYFNPDAVDALRKISEVEVFWLSLLPRHLPMALEKFKPARPMELGLAELESLASIFAKIVDNKSPYTKDHSEGVGRLAQLFGRRLGLSEVTVRKLRIAGLMHDLGKLAIPDEILEKPASLTDEEFQIVKRHPFETFYILSGLPELEDIRDWASFHHEKFDGSGYPFHLQDGDFRREHIIVMLADIIQALIQDRPYRVGLDKYHVLDILDHLALKHPMFEELVDIVRNEYDLVASVANGEADAVLYIEKNTGQTG